MVENIVDKRFTPEVSIERFAERLYNYSTAQGRTIQTKLDFDIAYSNFMEGATSSKELENKSWDIIASKISTRPPTLEEKRGAVKTRKKFERALQKPKLKLDTLAKIYNKGKKHYQVKYVARVVNKKGYVRYFDGKKFVKVERVSEFRK